MSEVKMYLIFIRKNIIKTYLYAIEMYCRPGEVDENKSKSCIG